MIGLLSVLKLRFDLFSQLLGAVCVFRRCVGRQKDFRADHAAFSGVVAVLAVVFAVQLFPDTVRGSSHGRLPRAALDLRYMKMK